MLSRSCIYLVSLLLFALTYLCFDAQAESVTGGLSAEVSGPIAAALTARAAELGDGLHFLNLLI